MRQYCSTVPLTLPTTHLGRVLAAGEEGEDCLLMLVKRMLVRDQAALSEFYDLTLSRVFGLVLRILRRPEDAEEVVGDVFLQVWERCADYRPERGSVMAWLNTLAWSRAVDRLRRQRRQSKETSLHPDDREPAYTECEDETAESMLDAWMSAAAIRSAFLALSHSQRQMLELAYFEDLSHQEIADRTGVALGTVKSHVRRGLAALRCAMNPGGQADVRA